MPTLSTPMRIGNSNLLHRLIMAPLTRFRSDDAHVPLDMMVEYYGQRASVPGTMLITEATFIHAAAGGYPSVPGIWQEEQIAAWRKVTEEVHAKKSFIYMQLWALGRTANPDALKKDGDYEVVGASDIPENSEKATPKALTEPQIKEYVTYYAQAAKNAVEAGFDGVEIHGANGYLVDQFTQDTSNNRTDKYGGSVENRARFGLEVAAAVVEAIGAERTGIRISPWSTFQAMGMKDPIPQFSYYVEELAKLDLAFLHIVMPRISGSSDTESGETIDELASVWKKASSNKPLLVAGGFRGETARKELEHLGDENVAIVFGRYFISNPDLPFRVLNDIELTPYDRATFYNPRSKEGYTTYPFSKEFEQAAIAVKSG